MSPSTKFLKFFRRYKKETWLNILEWLLIAAWGIWVGRDMLHFDENLIPWGREYGMAISTHHFWTFVRQCGYCAVWDDSQIGGYPALTNTYAAILHPITMITTLIWGVVNGSKVMVVLSLMGAGIAQWWLSYELKLGRFARIWASLLVVVGGHLSAKLELGVLDIVLSTVMTSLIFPAILMLIRKQDWRSTVVLALVISSAVFSGQGYAQVLFVISLPALSFLLFERGWKIDPIWKKFLTAGGLVVLLTAIFTMPLLVNGWNIHKSTLPDFVSLQPLKYNLLNFVIDDMAFYRTEALGKWANPSLYINFIGWLPVLLSIFAVGAYKKQDSKKILYLATSAALILGFVNPDFLKWVFTWFEPIASLRFPNLGLGVSVILLVGLAGYGLDQLLKRVQWPTIHFTFGKKKNARTFYLPASVFLLIPLIFNVQQGYNFGRQFLNVSPLWPTTVEKLKDLKTDSLEWVLPVLGEQFWTEPAVRLGLKVTNESLPFWTGVKHYPNPYLQLSRFPVEPGSTQYTLVREYSAEFLYLDASAEYAYIVDATGYFHVCQASGAGGKIDVVCNAPVDGYLLVHENIWSGWKVWVDGTRADLYDLDGWMQVAAPSGAHTYTFRYLPWEIPVAVLVGLFGLLLCSWLWRNPLGDFPPDLWLLLNNKKKWKSHKESSKIIALALLGGLIVLFAVINYRSLRMDLQFSAVWFILFGFLQISVSLLLMFNEQAYRWWALKLKKITNWLAVDAFHGALLGTSLVFSYLAVISSGFEPALKSPFVAISSWLVSILLAVWGASNRSTFEKYSFKKTMYWLIPILIFALWVRVFNLNTLPLILSGDEAGFGINAADFVKGKWNNPFIVGWYSFPTLYPFIQSFSIRLLGQTIFALRITSILAGVGTVAAVYFLGRQMFNLRVGIFSALVLSALHTHVFFSRLALNNVWDGLWITITLGFIWYGWENKNRLAILLGGLAFGFSQYFYYSARVLIGILFIALIFAWLKERARFRQLALSIVLAGFISAVILLPLTWFFINLPEQYYMNMDRVLVPLNSNWIDQLMKGFGAFIISPFQVYYDIETPLLHPLSAFFFLIGFLSLIITRRDSRLAFLSLWLISFGLMGALSESTPAPQRYVGAAPLCALLIGLGIDRSNGFLEKYIPRILKRTSLFAFIVITMILMIDLYTYFFAYSSLNTADNTKSHGMIAHRLGEYLAEKPQGTTVLFFGNTNMKYYSVLSAAYMAPQVSGVDILDTWASYDHSQLNLDQTIFVFLSDKKDQMDKVTAEFPSCSLASERAWNNDVLFWAYDCTTY